MTTNVNYHSGNTRIFLNWRWIEGTRNAEEFGAVLFGGDPAINLIETIKRKNYIDLGVGYAINDNVTARLTVANLFDSGPAFMADAAGVNTDPGMYDLFGRSYTLAFSLEY